MTDRYLSADDILGMADGEDLPIHEVEIPEWKKDGEPGILRYRAMTADRALAFNESIKIPAKRADAWVRILAECACNEDGSLMFPDKAVLAKLKTRNAAVFMRLQEGFMAVNGNARNTKTLEEAKEILEGLGAEGSLVEAFEARWGSPEATAKNS